MKKFLYILPIAALLATSCSQKNVLEGNVTAPGNEGKTVYLVASENFDSRMLPVDSTNIKDGKFKFDYTNNINGLGVGYIVIKEAAEKTANGISVVYEEGNINMQIDSVSRVSGTPLNDRNQAFFDEINVVSKKGAELNEKMLQVTEDSVRQVYIEQMMDLNTQANTIIYDFVKENMTNKVGEFYFRQFMQSFNLEQFTELMALARPEYKQEIDELINVNNNPENDFMGKQYIDVTGTNPKGKKISLSDYVGKNKVVLIDFWASWCGPCIKEMPHVIDAYNKYKSKGFEIVGISLDESKEDWTKAIKDMDMTWPQMSDLKGWQSELSAVYNVHSIPFTLLVNQDGEVIAQNLRGKALENKLEEVLND